MQLMEDMDLIKRLSDFDLKARLGLNVDDFEDYQNYRLVYSSTIGDAWYNYITNIQCSNEDEFKKIIDDGALRLQRVGRNLSVSLLPTMPELYENRDKYFNEKFDLVSNIVWQVFDSFDKIDDIESNCPYKIELVKTENMDEFADALIEAYRTGDSDDPYGDLDPAYRDAYANYVNNKEGFNDDFFIIKANGEIVGITRGAYDREFYGIYGIAINIKHRAKGIGTEVLKMQLRDCWDKGLKMAFLETEVGFYPEKLYRKIGFRDVCIRYIYAKK